MPKFTITRDGQTVKTLTLEGEQIDMGSSQGCPVFIDDVLISFRQARFVVCPEGYRVEPIAHNPVFHLNGQPVDKPMLLDPGATIEIEGYKIRVDFERPAGIVSGGPLTGGAGSVPGVPSNLGPVPPPDRIPVSVGSEPPAAPPPASPPPFQDLRLDDLPPPLPEVSPTTSPPARIPPRPSPGVGELDDQKTVFVVLPKPVGTLVVVSGPLMGHKWPLIPGEIGIGRDESQNDIVIRFDAKGEPDKSISRRHALVRVEGGDAYVEDLGSQAGTFVNKRQLPPKQRTLLKTGDLVEIRSAKKSTVFRVELDPIATGAPMPVPSALEVPLPPPLDLSRPGPAPLRENPPPLQDLRPVRPMPIPMSRDVAEPRAEPLPELAPRQSRVRPRGASDDSLFLPMEELSWRERIPTWGWIGGGVALLIIVVSLLLVCR